MGPLSDPDSRAGLRDDLSQAPSALRERLTGGGIADFLAFWLEECPLEGAERASFEHYYRSYRRHFGAYLRGHYARQTGELLRLIESGEVRRVLEVGCGCGTEALWAALKGAAVTGIDISRDLLKTAERRQAWLEAQLGKNLDCRFEHRSVLAMTGEPFDAVYLEQAFHHLEPRAEAIERLAALVRPGGRLVISETNGWNPLVQILLFRRRGFRTISSYEGHAWGHERITVAAALLGQFCPLGFRKETLVYYRALPNVRIADRLGRAERLLPGVARPLFTHYNLVLRKI